MKYNCTVWARWQTKHRGVPKVICIISSRLHPSTQTSGVDQQPPYHTIKQ